MGATHRLLGGCAGIAWASASDLGPAQTAVSVAVAVLTSAGLASPDVDLSALWRSADRWLPDEWLGSGGPMQHRGITHWWALPLALALFARYALPPSVWWLVGAAVVGWTSHLLGDLVFGRADVRSARGPGVPVMPWWGHVGLGLDVDGVLERVVLQRLVLPGLLVWQTLVAFGWADVLMSRVGRAVTAAWGSP